MVLRAIVKLAAAATLALQPPQPIYTEYNQYAKTYDDLNGGAIADDFGIQTLRREMGQFVSGKVLDVAVGTGLQNSFYDWNRISGYVGMIM